MLGISAVCVCGLRLTHPYTFNVNTYHHMHEYLQKLLFRIMIPLFQQQQHTDMCVGISKVVP